MTSREDSTPKRGGAWRDLVVAGTLGLAAIGVLAVGTGGGPASARAGAVDVIGPLAANPTEKDVLPDGFPAEVHGDGGLAVSSARSLGEDRESAYWAALDGASNICLVAQSLAEPGLTASSCSDADLVKGQAIDLRVDGEEWQVEAFLVPDSVDLDSVSGAWRVIDPNLVTASGHVDDATIELPRKGGQEALTLTRSDDAAGPHRG